MVAINQQSSGPDILGIASDFSCFDMESSRYLEVFSWMAAYMRGQSPLFGGVNIFVIPASVNFPLITSYLSVLPASLVKYS